MFHIFVQPVRRIDLAAMTHGQTVLGMVPDTMNDIE